MGAVTAGASTDPLDDRQQLAQNPPAPGLDLSGFPADPIADDELLFRAHGAGNGPWWFTNAGEGRFDLPAPRGTCYAADAIAVALRERFGRQYVGGGAAPARLVDDTKVTEIIPPVGRGANLEHEDVANYPVTGELSNLKDYEISRAWAAAFDASGFDAIHYRGRLSHAYGVACWALFDDAGAKSYQTGATMSGRDACAQAGIKVMPPPPTDPSTLRIATPPRMWSR